jgi:hypothetical protein
MKMLKKRGSTTDVAASLLPAAVHPVATKEAARPEPPPLAT